MSINYFSIFALFKSCAIFILVRFPMKKGIKEYAIDILFFGSLWGGLEVLTHYILKSVNYSGEMSPIFFVIGILILTFARYILNVPGTTLMIGVVASGFKLFAPKFFLCHMLGVVVTAGAIDLLYTLSFNKLKDNPFILGFFAVIGAYLSFFAFSFLQTNVFMHPDWLRGVKGTILQFTFITGSYAAIGGYFAAVVGSFMSKKLSSKYYEFQMKNFSTYSTIAAITICFCWALGFLL